MNLATPFLICHQNEDFRSLLREMLTKHGFFHVMEASSSAEARAILSKEKKSHFVLIQSTLIDDSLIPLLLKKQDSIILAQVQEATTLNLAARLGVKRFMSFPFSSQGLLEKIQQISQ